MDNGGEARALTPEPSGTSLAATEGFGIGKAFVKPCLKTVAPCILHTISTKKLLLFPGNCCNVLKQECCLTEYCLFSSVCSPSTCYECCGMNCTLACFWRVSNLSIYDSEVKVNCFRKWAVFHWMFFCGLILLGQSTFRSGYVLYYESAHPHKSMKDVMWNLYKAVNAIHQVVDI